MVFLWENIYVFNESFPVRIARILRQCCRKGTMTLSWKYLRLHRALEQAIGTLPFRVATRGFSKIGNSQLLAIEHLRSDCGCLIVWKFDVDLRIVMSVPFPVRIAFPHHSDVSLPNLFENREIGGWIIMSIRLGEVAKEAGIIHTQPIGVKYEILSWQ